MAFIDFSFHHLNTETKRSFKSSNVACFVNVKLLGACLLFHVFPRSAVWVFVVKICNLKIVKVVFKLL